MLYEKKCLCILNLSINHPTFISEALNHTKKVSKSAQNKPTVPNDAF